MSSGAEHFGEIILAQTKTFWLLGNQREVAGFLAKKFWRSCQHRIPYVQRKALRQTGFFPQKNMFDCLFWFLMKSRICGRSFRQGCQKKSTWPEEVFGKTLLGRIYYFKSFDGFCEENLLCKETQGSSVRHSTRPVEHSKGRNSGRNKTFLNFGHWARIFGFLAK